MQVPDLQSFWCQLVAPAVRTSSPTPGCLWVSLRHCAASLRVKAAYTGPHLGAKLSGETKARRTMRRFFRGLVSNVRPWLLSGIEASTPLSHDHSAFCSQRTVLLSAAL